MATLLFYDTRMLARNGIGQNNGSWRVVDCGDVCRLDSSGLGSRIPSIHHGKDSHGLAKRDSVKCEIPVKWAVVHVHGLHGCYAGIGLFYIVEQLSAKHLR